MARFAHEVVEQDFLSTIAGMRTDQGRIQHIKTFIESNLEATENRLFRIHYMWQWLMEHAPETAEELNASRENLQQLLNFGRTVVSQFTAKAERIASRWPEWNWDLGQYTPIYSGTMVEALIKLSHVIKDNIEDRRRAPLLLRTAVRDRLRARRSVAQGAASKLQTADITAVWRRVGGKTRQESTIERLVAGASLSSSPEIETGRGRGLPTRRASPSSLLDTTTTAAGSSSFLTIPMPSPQPVVPGPSIPAATSLLDAFFEPQSSSSFEELPGSQPSPRELKPAQHQPGFFAGKQASESRPPKRARNASPSPSLPPPPPSPPSPPPPPSPSPPTPAAPLPPAPMWADVFAEQLRHDQARLDAATTTDEAEAARAQLNATVAFRATFEAAMPPHFRGA